MTTYRILYTRRDPVYGKGWIIVSYRSISAKRTIKAESMEVAQKKVLDSILKDRPESIVEFATMMVVS